MSLAHDAPLAEPPGWTKTADALLAWAEPQVRLLGSLTPLNLACELASAAACLERRDPRLPRFEYPRPPATDPRPELDRAAEQLENLGPLGLVYAARARELSLEAAMSRSANSPDLTTLAARRYRERDRHHGEAQSLAKSWLEAPEAPEGEEERLLSDDESDPRSLLSRLRAEVGRRRLPFRVQATDRIAALAATGPEVIYVARNRTLNREDVDRTVLHEIEGHALPRARARGLIGIFARGTAFGSDDQEGRALAIERAHGRLGLARKRELARRDRACRSMRGGADFIETARELISDTGAGAADAVRIAARAHRGGGLGREAVYLPALLRVEAALSAEPELDNILARGQVAVESAPTLRRFLAG